MGTVSGPTQPSASSHSQVMPTSGSSISDGGGDMYDGGNQISFKLSSGAWSSALTYTPDGCTGRYQFAGHGDVYYYTCKTSSGPFFVAQMQSAGAGIYGFKISGNLGADNGGSVTGSCFV